MSVHLDKVEEHDVFMREFWCDADSANTCSESTHVLAKANCFECLLACAEYGSEARHRREVLIEAGAKP